MTRHAWYALEVDPDRPLSEPWFEVLGTLVYPTTGHPVGQSSRPWYQVRGNLVFRVGTHPESWSPEPSFRIEEQRVVPIGADWRQPASGDESPAFRIGLP